MDAWELQAVCTISSFIKLQLTSAKDGSGNQPRTPLAKAQNPVTDDLTHFQRSAAATARGGHSRGRNKLTLTHLIEVAGGPRCKLQDPSLRSLDSCFSCLSGPSLSRWSPPSSRRWFQEMVAMWCWWLAPLALSPVPSLASGSMSAGPSAGLVPLVHGLPPGWYDRVKSSVCGSAAVVPFNRR
jgi:hypothetical protein